MMVETKVAGTGDGMGGYTEGYWEETREVFASIWELRGQEAVLAQQMNPVATVQVRMRYIPDLKSSNRLRLADTTRYFDIVHIANSDLKDRVLKIFCREEV